VDVLNSLKFVSGAFFVFVLAAPIAMGGYMLLFSRRFSVAAYRWRQEVWKMGHTDRDVRLGQAVSLIVGGALVVFGLIAAVQQLSV
jgi:hypothetical protein